MSPSRVPDLKRALGPVPLLRTRRQGGIEDAGGRGNPACAAGALAANAYRRRPRTTEDIDFLVGREALERLFENVDRSR